MKAINVEYLTPQGLKRLRETVKAFSEAEGLPAHGLAVEKRFKGRKGGRRR
jgi:histidinol dehydrogenase